MAPELFTSSNIPDDSIELHKVDVWSAGVVLYTLVNGVECLQFKNGDNVSQQSYNTDDTSSRSLTQSGDGSAQHSTVKKFNFDDLFFSDSSEFPNMNDIKETLKIMLVVDPKERADWEKIMESHWLVRGRAELSFNVEGYEGCKLYTLPVLGSGATGVVFKGDLHPEKPNEQPVAMKRISWNYFVPPNEELRGMNSEEQKEHKKETERMRRMLLNEEVCILKRLQKTKCENVIKFYGIATGDFLKRDEIFDEMTLVFEYCPMTLTSRIKSGLTEYECHKFMNDIVKGLKALYDLGYSHRDIKPDNILIRTRIVNGVVVEETAVVTDFGFARSLSDLTIRCVTPGYMAPEVKNNKENMSSELMDIYSLGMTMWHMLTGINHPEKEDPETDGFEFVTLPNKLRCLVTNSCWETVKYMLMKNPKYRMTYEELWNNKWLKASDEELSDCYMKDRMMCLDRIWPEPRSDIQECVIDVVKKQASFLWERDYEEDVKCDKKEESKHVVNRRKVYMKARENLSFNMNKELEPIRKKLEEIAKSHAREGALCESLLPLRAISEYKISITYLSIILTMCGALAKEQRDRWNILDLEKVLSSRISELENNLLKNS